MSCRLLIHMIIVAVRILVRIWPQMWRNTSPGVSSRGKKQGAPFLTTSLFPFPQNGVTHTKENCHKPTNPVHDDHEEKQTTKAPAQQQQKLLWLESWRKTEAIKSKAKKKVTKLNTNNFWLNYHSLTTSANYGQKRYCGMWRRWRWRCWWLQWYWWPKKEGQKEEG